MKKEALIFNLIASIIVVIAMVAMPFVAIKGHGLTLFELIENLGRSSSGIAISLISLFLAAINAIIVICGLANTSFKFRIGIIIISFIALAVFLYSDALNEDSESGAYTSLIGLIVMAISSLCISNIDSTNETNRANETNESKKSEDKVISKESLLNYSDANKYSTDEIENILNSDTINDLNADYIKTLKYIINERAEADNINRDRESAYNSAILIDDTDRNNRLNSPQLYTPLNIDALKYIDRSIQCGIKPTLNGFKETFTKGYIAPETPLEYQKRLEDEELKRQYAKQLQLNMEKDRRKTKRSAIYAVSSIVVITIISVAYIALIKPLMHYNNQIKLAEDHIINENYKAAREIYDNIEIPTLGSSSKLEYIETQNKNLESIIAEILPREIATRKQNGFVYIEGGTFNMGSSSGGDDEQPVHREDVKSFFIGTHEVTQSKWQSVMGNNPSKFKGGENPVESVSWFDCIQFCNTLSRNEGLAECYTIKNKKVTFNHDANGYRLPTETEWEFAARDGVASTKSYKYSGSNDISIVAWYKGNSKSKTHAVGQNKPNELGIYDMSGNVYEWCANCYTSKLIENADNMLNKLTKNERVCRGGSFAYGHEYCRTTFRSNRSPDTRSNRIGFRLAINAPTLK